MYHNYNSLFSIEYERNKFSIGKEMNKGVSDTYQKEIDLNKLNRKLNLPKHETDYRNLMCY